MGNDIEEGFEGIDIKATVNYEMGGEFQLISDGPISESFFIIKGTAKIMIGEGIVRSVSFRKSVRLTAEEFGKITSGDIDFKLGL